MSTPKAVSDYMRDMQARSAKNWRAVKEEKDKAARALATACSSRSLAVSRWIGTTPRSV